jgi:hypothetical protein
MVSIHPAQTATRKRKRSHSGSMVVSIPCVFV